MNISIIEKKKIFTPEFNGNRDLPAAEQLRVHYGSFPGPTDNYRKVFRKEGAVAIDYDDVSLIFNHVDHFENFTFQGKEIKTPSDLFKITCKVLAPLITEIRDYAQEREELSEGESKASE